MPLAVCTEVRRDQDLDLASRRRSVLVPRRGQRSRRPSTTARSSRNATACSARDLRADQGLRVPVRKYKRMKYQGHRLRESAASKSPVARPARAHGPYRARHPPGRPHLVRSRCPSRIGPARHDAADLERILYFENYVVIEPGLTATSEGPAADRGGISRAQDGMARTSLHRHDRRRGDARDAAEPTRSTR